MDTSLAVSAVTKALQTRKNCGYSLHEPLCIYDLAEALKVEVRFVDVPTMEGIYIGNISKILVSSLRPYGRQVYTCAHEIGHHVYGHGLSIDEINDTKNANSQEENLAETFAGILLMPKIAIEKAFKNRNWNYQSINPMEYFTIAWNFGVGYETLVKHMCFGLRLIQESDVLTLMNLKPKDIKKQFVPDSTNFNVIPIDSNWSGRPIDIFMDDVVVLSERIDYAGQCITTDHSDSHQTILKGIAPGIGQIHFIGTEKSLFIRVSRKGYVGRSIYRHLEEI